MDMTISQAIKKSGIERREAEEMLAFVLKRDRAYVIAHATEKLKPSDNKKYNDLCERRGKGEPFAYLVGYQPFLGHDFTVDKNTLIPRPETEGLAERAIERAKIAHRLRAHAIIVDVGTGSGCIAISASLACPHATVIASDMSDKALNVARKNAKRLGAQVKFIKDDLFGSKIESRISKFKSDFRKSKFSAAEIRPSSFALILVANLPYLPSADKLTMSRDVVKYEPSKALFAGKDGTHLIVKLLKQIARIANISARGGCASGAESRSSNPTFVNRNSAQRKFDIRYSMFFEIDPSQTDKLKKLAHELFPKHLIKVERDWCGRERYLIMV